MFRPIMSWTLVNKHRMILGVGSHSETLRPTLNGLNYDPNQTNDHVFNNTTASFTSIKTIKSLKCWSTNADSLFNKMDELKARIYLFNPDIIAITEIYPKYSLYEITVTELSIDSYDVFYNDISSARRGVCIYIKSCLNAYLDDTLCSSGFSESVWCRIPLTGRDLMLIGAIYRSPNNDMVNFSHLCNLMNLAFNSSTSHVLVTGNFNMPLINWTSWTVGSQSSLDAEFLDLVNDSFISQHVNFPTRIREGQAPSLLDLVLTNDESFISEITSLPPLGKSDHVTISFDFQCYLKINGSRNYKYNYGRGDYQSMTSELLNINWTILSAGLDINATWSLFHSIMLQLIDKYVPTSLIRPVGPRPMWMNSAALKAVKQKRRAWMKYKATRLRSDFIVYTKYRNLSTAAVRVAKFSFERNLASKVKSNIGSMLGVAQK